MIWTDLLREWPEPDAEPVPEPRHRCGGEARVDDGRPLPGPRPCTWCGTVVRAVVVERWEARCFREVFEPGTMQPWDKKYKTPIKMLVVGYPCICYEHPPYSHWIVAVRLKKTAGWDGPAV